MTLRPEKNQLAELRVAAMTLSRLPVGRVEEPVPSMGSTRWAYPLVGAILGVFVGGAYVIFEATGMPALVAAFLAVTMGVLATGGLHEDGLADCADGFWGGRDRARKLEIMRDSRIGSYGTLALILSVGMRVAAIAALAVPFWSIVGVAVLSRFAMVAAMEWLPPARNEGLGATASDGASQLAPAAFLSIAGVAALVLGVGPSAWITLPIMAFAALIFAHIARRHIGGQTGDVLGAVQQVSEIAGLVALSALSA